MSSKDVAVSVRGISKAYTLTHNEGRRKTVREALHHRLRNPLRRMERETFWALKDVSFDIHKGDVVGIIGRNGAGKSTLLKILSQITKPTTGEVRLYGRVGSLLEVGTGFHPELTGGENIFLNGAILGMRRKEIDRQFDAIVNFAEVEKFVDTPVKRYSSGMYVRLAFAVAAHLNPEILVVDEVLAVGDAAFQKKCLGKIQDVAHQGRTVLFVSHSMTTVQQLCTRAVLLKSGRVAMNGRTDEVMPYYFGDALSSTSADFDLSSHPARLNGCQPIIRRLRLLDHSGTPSIRFFPEQSLTAELHIQTPRRIREPRCALAVEDASGRRIFTVASYFREDALREIDGSCVVRCTIPRLNLGVGRYLVSVSINDVYDGLLDSLDYVAWIEVEWHNNYNNGEPYNSVYGPVLKDSSWHLNEEEHVEEDRLRSEVVG